MVKTVFKKNLFTQRLLRSVRLKYFQPSWKSIIEREGEYWRKTLSSRKDQNILVATSVGAYLGATMLESVLSVALTLRGVNVYVLLCDGILPACLDCMVGITISEKKLALSGPQSVLCKACFSNAQRMYCSLGIKVYRYSEFIGNNDIARSDKISREVEFSEIKNYILDGVAVGEHALAGALRFYAKGNLCQEDNYVEKVIRRYFKAAVLTALMMRNLLDRNSFSRAVFHHGIYVPQGLIGEVCRQRGIGVVNWNPAYKKQCFIFSHKDTYHHTLMLESTDKWENVQWNTKIERKLKGYLKNRWYGRDDWIWFYNKPQMDIDRSIKKLGFDFSKPCIGLLTNVIWDAQLHYPRNVFSDMVDWVIQTINYFKTRSDLQLIIRIHPAEIRGTLPSRQPAAEEIRKAFPVLPENVFVIGPRSNISTYPLMAKCNAVIIYGTKTGVELTSVGIPVIVAGEAWIRNKGITIDPESQEKYFQILDQLPLARGLNQKEIQRAHKYAYHFFFRRMIPLGCIKPSRFRQIGLPYDINLSTIGDLLPRKDKGLDVICDGILHGRDFIYPAETL